MGDCLGLHTGLPWSTTLGARSIPAPKLLRCYVLKLTENPLQFAHFWLFATNDRTLGLGYSERRAPCFDTDSTDFRTHRPARRGAFVMKDKRPFSATPNFVLRTRVFSATPNLVPRTVASRQTKPTPYTLHPTHPTPCTLKAMNTRYTLRSTSWRCARSKGGLGPRV